MKTKITGPQSSESNNAAIRRRSRAPSAESARVVSAEHGEARHAISDAAMILARQVAHLGLAALRDEAMRPSHALRGLMSAMITVSSAVMDRPDVVTWFRALADELEAEEREEYGAKVRASLRGSPDRRGPPD